MNNKNMQEDKIIQKNLFALSDEPKDLNNHRHIPDDLSAEELEKVSQKRPRQRNNSTNSVSYTHLTLPTKRIV